MTSTASDRDAHELSLVVFAYDERENVGPILAELIDWLNHNEPSFEIVFVDDGSRDDSLAAARAALVGVPHALVRHEVNRGIGAALKSGVTAARGRFVTFLPADGQIAPEAIGTLLGAARRDRVDLVLSVYRDRDDGVHRKLLSAGVRALIVAVHGARVRSDGPYLFRRTLFDGDQLPPDTFFLNFEFPIRAKNARVPLTTVTIECRPRRSGTSKSAKLSRVVGVARDLLDLRRRRTRDALRRAFGG